MEQDEVSILDESSKLKFMLDGAVLTVKDLRKELEKDAMWVSRFNCTLSTFSLKEGVSTLDNLIANHESRITALKQCKEILKLNLENSYPVKHPSHDDGAF